MIKKSQWLFMFVLVIPVISCRERSMTSRNELISGYKIESNVFDSLNPLKVGNPEFTFKVDFTGLQTFPEYCMRDSLPGTVSTWTRSNPCKFNLGMVGLQILKKNGIEISLSDIEKPIQKLNLWTGEIESMFSVDEVPVYLKTVCHSDYDLISVKIRSRLIAEGRLGIKISFTGEGSAGDLFNYNSDYKHNTRTISDTNNITVLSRIMDHENYFILLWRNGAVLREVTKQLYYLEPGRKDSVYSFSCQFMNDQANGRVQNFGETAAASRKSWSEFWNSMDEKDFRKYSRSQDMELNRHAILLRYLDRISCTASNVRKK